VPKPTAATDWSDAYGLRKVISNGEAGDDIWPSASGQRRVKDAGLVHFENTAEVSVLQTIPDTKQRWDRDYPRTDVTQPSESGPAVKRLRGSN
jgi:hypothetical protein